MKAVKGYRYLFRRGEQLYFRRRVPLSARLMFDGREEVQKALGTSNIAEARHMLAIEVATFDKMMADAAGKPVAHAVRQIVPSKHPSATEMEEAVRKWLSERVERATSKELALTSHKDLQNLWDGLQSQVENVKQGIGLGAAEPAVTTVWLAEDICAAEGWEIKPSSSEWRMLVRLIGRGQIEANSWLAADLNGDARTTQDFRFSPEQYRLDEQRQAARLPWLEGFRPLPNVQTLLEAVIIDAIDDRPHVVEASVAASADFSAFAGLEVSPPSRTVLKSVEHSRRACRVDYAARDERNRALGRAGEEWAVRYFEATLTSAGRRDLADRIEWVSQSQGDGLGYDIAAFDLDGLPIFVEVKATNGAIGAPFVLTSNELAVSRELGSAFRLMRIFNFSSSPRFYFLKGDLAACCDLTPQVYRATPYS